MSKITVAEVVRACQTLFGKNVKVTRDFLLSLKPGGVRSAYRKKAKENHPDLFAAYSTPVQKRQTERFREIILAYDVLNLFFRQRDAVSRRPPAPRKPAPAHGRKQRDDGRASGRPAAPKGTYYRGTIPHEILQIGQYLYYRGRISFDALINSLIWQRKQRPCIGDIAVQWGWLDEEGQQRILRACSRQRHRLFGGKAVDLGLLSEAQVNAILLHQRAHQERLGAYFVRNKILSSQDMELLVRELKEHNAVVLAGLRPAARAKAVFG